MKYQTKRGGRPRVCLTGQKCSCYSRNEKLANTVLFKQFIVWYQINYTGMLKRNDQNLSPKLSNYVAGKDWGKECGGTD